MQVLKARQWDRIEKRAGPHREWPGYKVYRFCPTSLEGRDTEDFFKRLRSDAKRYGWRLEDYGGHYYLVKPL